MSRGNEELTTRSRVVVIIKSRGRSEGEVGGVVGV